MIKAYNDIIDSIYIYDMIYGGLQESVARADLILSLAGIGDKGLGPKQLLEMAEWARDTDEYRKVKWFD